MGSGNSVTQDSGDSGTQGSGDSGTQGSGDSGTQGSGDSGTKGSGDSGTQVQWGQPHVQKDFLDKCGKNSETQITEHQGHTGDDFP
ncbi:hypothetical protein O3P69_020726 [Scylla paramamosain]|uniref:Uncharacterized protein n=1 Tax=Scylla paramamosain TaxID=85552 RepID=A0AAW0TNS9_SCYPA